MSARRCAPGCPRARERRRCAFEAYENEQSYHRNGTWTSTTNSDYDYDISDSTEYQSLPGRNSTPNRDSRPSRESIAHVETPPQSREEILGKSSTCLSGHNYSHHSSHKSKKKNNSYQRSHNTQGEKSQLSRHPETSSRSKETEHHTNHQVKYGGERKQHKCPNDDCSPSTYDILFTQRQKSQVESSGTETENETGQSESESLVCPELCEHDLLRIPSLKKTCESSCQKQAWLDKQRKKQQAQVDRYILNKGLNYFEDLCHCSLKCLMTQICMDPFVKKTVASAAFFFLGIKLCFELDSWYIPF